MKVIKYPKIETLFDRNKDFVVDPGRWRRRDFPVISQWEIYEKIDGTNIRIHYIPSETMSDGTVVGGIVNFYSRNSDEPNVNIPPVVLKFLRELFDYDRISKLLFTETILFGEAFGGKIQGMSKLYGTSPRFALFDVIQYGYWQSRDVVFGKSVDLEVEMAPLLGVIGSVELLNPYARVLGDYASVSKLASTSQSHRPEGVILHPRGCVLQNGYGERVIAKLKWVDFEKGHKAKEA